MNATTQTASRLSKESQGRILLASRRHKRLFAANVIWLALAGLFTVWLSWRVWKASNDEQFAVNSAANERITAVEGESANAKSELGRVQIQLEEQREKTEQQRKRAADSERQLIELQKLVREDRTFNPELADVILKSGEKGKIVSMGFVIGNEEAGRVANKILELLSRYGWDTSKAHANPAITDPPSKPGVFITMLRPIDTSEQLKGPLRTLYQLFSVALSTNPQCLVRFRDTLSPDEFEIFVGPKY